MSEVKSIPENLLSPENEQKRILEIGTSGNPFFNKFNRGGIYHV